MSQRFNSKGARTPVLVAAILFALAGGEASLLHQTCQDRRRLMPRKKKEAPPETGAHAPKVKTPKKKGISDNPGATLALVRRARRGR